MLYKRECLIFLSAFIFYQPLFLFIAWLEQVLQKKQGLFKVSVENSCNIKLSEMASRKLL